MVQLDKSAMKESVMDDYGWLAGALIGGIAALFAEISDRVIMPRIRRRWPKKEKSIFVDPDKYMAKMRKRGEWN